ncbi:MAG: DUF721 domain-containing protein [Candidatus Moranbacteria bacterium]|nr:DUF721 domain-containing protein [Candidatus Moranbacteria bacterium]
MKRLGDMMSGPVSVAGGRAPRRAVVADEKTVFFLAERVIGGMYGDRGRENLKPRFFRNGKLFIACSGPLWANELWIGREAFRERINRELGSDGVRGVGVSD